MLSDVINEDQSDLIWARTDLGTVLVVDVCGGGGGALGGDLDLNICFYLLV